VQKIILYKLIQTSIHKHI